MAMFCHILLKIRHTAYSYAKLCQRQHDLTEFSLIFDGLKNIFEFIRFCCKLRTFSFQKLLGTIAFI